ncbi:MAG TPA: hypothetical protein VJP88_05140 [Caulobacteraceae bacterium]|nr:hypothetical protein [Caulobacteraceae bacterium]
MIQVTRAIGRLAVVGMATIGGLSLSACATKEYVDQRIDEVNTHISAVDAKATAADQKADQALSAAQAAQAAAAQANERIDSLSTTVQQAPRRTPHG